MMMPPQQPASSSQRSMPLQAPFGRHRTTNSMSSSSGGVDVPTQLPGLSRGTTGSSRERTRGRARTSVKLTQLLESESKAGRGPSHGPGLVRLGSNSSLSTTGSSSRTTAAAQSKSLLGPTDLAPSHHKRVPSSSNPTSLAGLPGLSGHSGLSGRSVGLSGLSGHSGLSALTAPSDHHNNGPASLYGTRRSKDLLDDNFEDSQSSFFYDPDAEAEQKKQTMAAMLAANKKLNNQNKNKARATAPAPVPAAAPPRACAAAPVAAARPKTPPRASVNNSHSSNQGGPPPTTRGLGMNRGPSKRMNRQESRKTLEELATQAQNQGASMNEETFEMEIAPGYYVPFRNANEVWQAVENGCTLECFCLECSIQLVCVADAEHVVCPDCSMVNPVFDRPAGTGTPYGAGMGLKKEWVDGN